MPDWTPRNRRGRILFSILALLFAVGVVPLVWTSWDVVTRSRESRLSLRAAVGTSFSGMGGYTSARPCILYTPSADRSSAKPPAIMGSYPPWRAR